MDALVVEDDPVQRRIIEATLQRMGFVVHHAHDGLSGLGLLYGVRSISVAIIDWHCRPLSGIGFLAAVRADGSFPDLKALMLTADDSAAHVLQARKHGADGYLIKPLRAPVLIQRLTEWGLVTERPSAGLLPGQQRIGIPPGVRTASFAKVTKDSDRR